jgi:hypothetical protein
MNRDSLPSTNLVRTHYTQLFVAGACFLFLFARGGEWFWGVLFVSNVEGLFAVLVKGLSTAAG